MHVLNKVQSDKLQVLDQAHRPVSQWGGGGSGGMLSQEFLEITCSEIVSETGFGSKYGATKNLTNKLTCMHCSITSQENLVQTCSFGCKSADTSPFSLRCLSAVLLYITVNCEQDCPDSWDSYLLTVLYCRLASGLNNRISLPTLQLISNEGACAWSMKHPRLVCKSSASTRLHLWKHTHGYGTVISSRYATWSKKQSVKSFARTWESMGQHVLDFVELDLSYQGGLSKPPLKSIYGPAT